MQSPQLIKVELFVSVSCHASISDTWSVLREFGKWGDFFQQFDDRVVQSCLVLGDHELQIGAKRIVQIGAGKVVEELTALDNEHHRMSYKLITHPANVNPFSASFVNYSCQVQLRPITLTKQTFVEMSVNFLTEPTAVEGMHNSMRYFNETCLQSLCHYLGHRGSMAIARSVPFAGGSNKPVGSFDLHSSGSIPTLSRSQSHPAAHLSELHHNVVSTDRQNSSDSCTQMFDSPRVLL